MEKIQISLREKQLDINPKNELYKKRNFTMTKKTSKSCIHYRKRSGIDKSSFLYDAKVPQKFKRSAIILVLTLYSDAVLSS